MLLERAGNLTQVGFQLIGWDPIGRHQCLHHGVGQ
jgi:hypothetical protein